NFPFFTIFIIHLQAKQPEINAAIKPIINDKVGIPDCSAENSPPINPKNDSPIIGTKTIRNENWASFSFLLPNSNPVAIVVPDLDNPGNTAKACDNPIIKASFIDRVSFC